MFDTDSSIEGSSSNLTTTRFQQLISKNTPKSKSIANLKLIWKLEFKQYTYGNSAKNPCTSFHLFGTKTPGERNFKVISSNFIWGKNTASADRYLHRTKKRGLDGLPTRVRDNVATDKTIYKGNKIYYDMLLYILWFVFHFKK